MGKKYRSARGEIVDMDLLRLKQSLVGKPAVPSVTARENFVDGKIKHRRTKKMPSLPQDLLNNIKKQETKKSSKEELKKEETEKEKPANVPKTKQRARPKIKKPEETTNVNTESDT